MRCFQTKSFCANFLIKLGYGSFANLSSFFPLKYELKEENILIDPKREFPSSPKWKNIPFFIHKMRARSS